jgi:uncharacterized protein
LEVYVLLKEKDIEFIAEKSEARFAQTKSVIEMLAEGMTVPFISRYRKEKTGDLDEVKVRNVEEFHQYVVELNERKETVIKTISGLGKLTDELRKKIEETYSKTELEDLYLPYKPKKRTRATIAKEKGLEPLALAILDTTVTDDMEEMAAPYINEEKKVATVKDALKGASDIIAEQFSEEAELRKTIRADVAGEGVLAVVVTKDWEEKRSKFEQYYDYSEKVATIPSHRILAVRRGETEKVLRSKVQIDQEELQNRYRSRLYQEDHPRYTFLEEVMKDALNRLILPSLELDVLREMKKQADEEAIRVFALNLEKLLLSSPAGNLRVLGVDPGYRTGCKLVALDETGKLLENATIYPTKPKEDKAGSKAIVDDMMAKHKFQAVAIGNGTGSRETFQFFKEIMPEEVIVLVVSESGASVYSASDAGREEFPEHDVTVRGAVSIGRRFQDPLSELVKIEPKAIGVGQYQHDVNQSLLKQRLDNVVVSVVNRVGVALNNASYHLLKYVSGIGETLAKNIVKYRDENGVFTSREDLKNVRMFGDKAFQQSSGFLRIRDGQNPLEATGIHPESYGVVDGISQKLALAIDNLMGNQEALKGLKPEEFVTDEFGLPTVIDIINELESPGRDPRKDFELFEYEEGVETIADLAEGMELKGVVTNVTQFGAFVDIGVHQDGLVHVSELSHDFVTNPETVVSVGDKVKVKVISVDTELKRIQLSIKALKPKPKAKQHKPRGKGRGGRQNKSYVKEQRQKPKKEDPIDALKKGWGLK